MSREFVAWNSMCSTFSTAKSARAYRLVGDLPVVSEFPKAQADHWHHRWIFGERNSSALLTRISRATWETKDGPWSSAERILSTETRCISEALTHLEVHKRITSISSTANQGMYHDFPWFTLCVWTKLLQKFRSSICSRLWPLRTILCQLLSQF